jgi:hypothetical protein
MCAADNQFFAPGRLQIATDTLKIGIYISKLNAYRGNNGAYRLEIDNGNIKFFHGRKNYGINKKNFVYP